MLFLTEHECKVAAGESDAAVSTVRSDGFNVEKSPARSLMWFSRNALLWVWESTNAPVLLWVVETGVWASDEHLYTYALLRKEMGDHEGVGRRPGHLGVRHEFEAMAALLFQSLTFGWGVRVLAGQSPRTVDVNHDGVVACGAESTEEARRFIDEVEKRAR